MNHINDNEAEPSLREGGQGPTVLCLHANASSSSQWRLLMDRLAPTCRVLAPDLLGAGGSPHRRPTGRLAALDDELALLAPVLARAGARFTLVGHSYGAALALLAAVRHADRVQALVLYEPTLFALVDAQRPPPNEVDALRAVVEAVAAALAHGHSDTAARHFIDYWMGAGSFAAMPVSRRESIESMIWDAPAWATALCGEKTPLSAFAALEMPVLLMSGSDSPASSLSVTRLLAAALPHVSHQVFAGLGHMAPVTHPQRVNERIAAFLRATHLATAA